MKKITDIEIAMKQFEEAAIAHEQATEKGDYKVANKSYTIITKAIAFLKEKSDIDKLSKFLTHESIGVRSWAATFLLPVQEDEAILVLEQIANGDGIRSFAAKTVLSEWRNGNLKL